MSNTMTKEQAVQKYHELTFLTKHHEELSKAYLRESIILEQAIRNAEEQEAQVSNEVEPQAEEVAEEVKEGNE